MTEPQRETIASVGRTTLLTQNYISVIADVGYDCKSEKIAEFIKKQWDLLSLFSVSQRKYFTSPPWRIEKRKNLKILVIGDVTSPAGVEHLFKNLWKFRKERGIDFCVVNGENASFITGISPQLAEKLLRGGADCITGGNHTMHNKQTYTFMEENAEIIRPLNFGASAPGRGYALLDACGWRMLVMNVMGNVHIEPVLDSPFDAVERALSECSGKYDFAILDVHAEATGEKLALAYAFDGRINVVFGTHTHVQTADAQIFPRGTGYITDIGMCGESGGVLGMDAERVVERMRTHLPHAFKAASGECVADGVIFTLDTSSGRVTSVELVKI